MQHEDHHVSAEADETKTELPLLSSPNKSDEIGKKLRSKLVHQQEVSKNNLQKTTLIAKQLISNSRYH